jgi:glycosyltransferase involved in cell wall biosynthesis
VIGYVGTIDYRIDLELLHTMAVEHPQWNIVLIGPTRGHLGERIKKLEAYDNFFFLGPKPPEDVPAYLNAFDVALIPFLVTPSTNTMYPYKLHEYLAMGKPVVSTDLFEVRPFDDVVRLAPSHELFLSAVGQELVGDSEEKQARRIDVARRNSWQERVEQMSALIEGAEGDDVRER